MDFITILKFILIAVVAYLMGNISFARIFSKMKHGDITKSGSGNPGTMNMLRTYGFKLGLLTLVCDICKGVVPALISQFIFGFGTYYGTISLYLCGVFVILGHNYPVFYHFKGGKGIACILGVFLVDDPIWVLVFIVLAFFALLILDYGSVVTLTIVSALIIIEGLQNYGNLAVSILLFIIFLLIWFAHRTNVRRLLVGKENKANLQKSLKKKFNKQKAELKSEYKQEKSEIKAEYKQEMEKAKAVDDKQKLKQERERYFEERRKKRREYSVNRRKVYNYSSIVSLVSLSEDEKKDNE